MHSSYLEGAALVGSCSSVGDDGSGSNLRKGCACEGNDSITLPFIHVGHDDLKDESFQNEEKEEEKEDKGRTSRLWDRKWAPVLVARVNEIN